MPPPRLPQHLSHKSTIALVPPSAITPAIEAVRRVRDKSFARWPPHINLIYPFLASPSEPIESAEGTDGGLHHLPQARLKEDIYSRIRKALENIPPFHISLSADPPGVFSHNKKSKTVWLQPLQQESPSVSTALLDLQAALQAEFSECDSDQRPFTPHLSVGQAWNNKTVADVQNEIKETVSAFISKDSSDEPEAQLSPIALDWYIDEVHVLERKTFNDRFRVIGTVQLGEA